jgi:hypothetical protein
MLPVYLDCTLLIVLSVFPQTTGGKDEPNIFFMWNLSFKEKK